MEIERDIIRQFVVWKDAERHKPILLKGARQIGKTLLISNEAIGF